MSQSLPSPTEGIRVRVEPLDNAAQDSPSILSILSDFDELNINPEPESAESIRGVEDGLQSEPVAEEPEIMPVPKPSLLLSLRTPRIPASPPSPQTEASSNHRSDQDTSTAPKPSANTLSADHCLDRGKKLAELNYFIPLLSPLAGQTRSRVVSGGPRLNTVSLPPEV
ncbi:hypothetical protein AX16_002267 [Volvariella volvacea WC 439]|nr:hypothetical protein AX16_002267 [Volvariella volvacea WC 439]